MANKNYELAHTKWMCKYHIVFTPKYRRKVIYNQLKVDMFHEYQNNSHIWFMNKRTLALDDPGLHCSVL